MFAEKFLGMAYARNIQLGQCAASTERVLDSCQSPRRQIPAREPNYSSDVDSSGGFPTACRVGGGITTLYAVRSSFSNFSLVFIFISFVFLNARQLLIKPVILCVPNLTVPGPGFPCMQLLERSELQPGRSSLQHTAAPMLGMGVPSSSSASPERSAYSMH